jgi:4-methylaminobutanoate oxidase (formaldehyde-forming)
MEKAYRHWGHDIDSDTTLLEAGLGFTAAWDKQDGFTGRDALLRQKQEGVKRRLVQFRLQDPDAVLFHDEPIWRDGKRVGRVTSAMHGHSLGAAIALGYVTADVSVTAEYIRAGSYQIEIAGQLVPAIASLAPMFDSKSERVLA